MIKPKGEPEAGGIINDSCDAETRGSNQIRFDLSEATYQFEPNSIFVDISFAAKYCQPTFGDKRRSRLQSKGENHTIEKLYGPPDEVCKVLKFLFSEYSTVGFLFAFYHHTYPGGKQKASNKSETLKLWGREISSKILEHINIEIKFLEFVLFYITLF